MKQVKYKVKSKVEIKGENVRLISESNESIQPLTRALIRGIRSLMDGGPLSPRYIKVGGPACTPHEVDHA
jgi:hypothetical protein